MKYEHIEESLDNLFDDENNINFDNLTIEEKEFFQKLKDIHSKKKLTISDKVLLEDIFDNNAEEDFEDINEFFQNNKDIIHNTGSKLLKKSSKQKKDNNKDIKESSTTDINQDGYYTDEVEFINENNFEKVKTNIDYKDEIELNHKINKFKEFTMSEGYPRNLSSFSANMSSKKLDIDDSIISKISSDIESEMNKFSNKDLTSEDSKLLLGLYILDSKINDYKEGKLDKDSLKLYLHSNEDIIDELHSMPLTKTRLYKIGELKQQEQNFNFDENLKEEFEETNENENTLSKEQLEGKITSIKEKYSDVLDKNEQSELDLIFDEYFSYILENDGDYRVVEDSLKILDEEDVSQENFKKFLEYRKEEHPKELDKKLDDVLEKFEALDLDFEIDKDSLKKEFQEKYNNDDKMKYIDLFIENAKQKDLKQIAEKHRFKGQKNSNFKDKSIKNEENIVEDLTPTLLTKKSKRNLSKHSL